MKNFDTLAQQVWQATNKDTKLEIVNQMIDQFKYKAKAQKFRAIAVTASSTKLDQLASNLMLNDTDAVVK